MSRAYFVIALVLLASCAALAAAESVRPASHDATRGTPSPSLIVPASAPAPVVHAGRARLGDRTMPAPAFGPAASSSGKPPEVRTVQPLDAPALAAALERQQAKLAEQRSPLPSRAALAPARVAIARPVAGAQVPGAIRAAERIVGTRLAAREPSRAVPARTPKPPPVTTSIPGTPLDIAQRAKLERALATQPGPARGTVSPVHDERK